MLVKYIRRLLSTITMRGESSTGLIQQIVMDSLKYLKKKAVDKGGSSVKKVNFKESRRVSRDLRRVKDCLIYVQKIKTMYKGKF